MKSRDLKTIHDLIVSNYNIEPIANDKFKHTFTPMTTDTVYTFYANGSPEIEEGEHYNIGYYTDDFGDNIVDISCLSKCSSINPKFSYAYACEISRGKHKINKQKNNDRVTHKATDGYYWGKKYAWREYGLVISKEAFYAYLNEVGHPQVECYTENPDMPYSNSPSIAYKDEGLKKAMEDLINTAVKVTNTKYKSPLYSKQFAIKGIEAITDKK